MYSIPVYALRFAAHCRSRLGFTELSQDDATRSSVDTAKIWIRLARALDRQGPDCAALRPTRNRS